MKLSSSLLQAITLSVSVTALAATTTSCEKENIKKTDRMENERPQTLETADEPCPACGMG